MVRCLLMTVLTVAALAFAGTNARAQVSAAPYDGDLQRLAEILGALHYLRGVCNANDGQKWRNEMQALIESLWRRLGFTALLVTHDVSEAIALADRVVIMSAGPSSRIIGDWRVELPRPRTQESRYHERFAEHSHQLRHLIFRRRDRLAKGEGPAGGGDIASCGALILAHKHL